MTTTSAVGTTGIDYIDSLLYGRKWDGTNLTIAFPDTAASVGYSLNGSYFTALSSTEQTAFKAILARWAAVSGLIFTEVEDPTQADISIYWYRSPDNLTARTVDFPQDTLQAGDIQLGSAISGADLSTAGTYSYFTALHEIGHALGLKHPSETINGFPGTTDISVETSVMSYISYEGGPTSGGYSINSGSYPSGPMMADIAAIQHLYGVNTNALTASIGDTTYTFDPTASVIFQTRWDGGGFDTFNFSSYTTDLSIDLRPGHWSDLGGQYAILDNSDINVKPLGNIAVPYLYNNNPAYLIEAAYGGSGDDLLIGNQANNLLRGTAGNDTMKGMGGTDTLAGGAGNDTFDLTDSTSGAVQISDFTNDDTIILPVSPGSISLGNGSALTAGQVSLGFTGVYNVLFIGLDGTPGYDFRISLANSTGYDNLSLSGNVSSRINDTRAPTFVAASGPVDDATMVSLSATPSLTFHEQVLPATGNFTIYNVTDGTVFKTITPNSGAVTGWNTPTITINPNYDGSTPLLGGKEYAVLWDATAVKDSSNNFAAANNDTTIYNFTTNIRPTATLEVADINGADAGETSYSFTVTYSDSDGSIDTSSIAPSNVTVTAPDSSALTVTSATWNAATNTATYTVTVPGTNGWNSTYDGTYTIALVDSEVKDDVGDSVTGNSTFGSFTVDLTAPTFLTWQLASDTGRLNNDGITNNGTLNVIRLETGATWEYSLDRGANWTTGSGTSFTLPEGSYADGYIIVRQTDSAGNLGSTGTNLIDLTIDTTAPGIVSIERVDASTGYTNADSLTFRVTFTEEIYGLAANITINGTTATISGSTRNGLAYDFTFTGGDLANLNGAVSISFASSGFADAAGNALVVTPTGANESYIIDNTVPLFVSGEADGDVVTLTFTEVVQRGATGSFVFYNVTDGQVVETIPYNDANITGWDTSSLTLTPSADLPGGKQISVRWTAGAVTDRAGNALAANSGNTLFNFDSNAQPTLGTVSADDVTQSAVGENSYSFTVSYADSDGTIDGTSIDTSDVTVTGPSGALTVTGAVWNASTGTATYTVATPGGTWNDADNGSYAIALLDGQVKDATGLSVAANNNLGSFTVTVDSTPPAAPVIALLADNGVSASDGLTNDGRLGVAGLEDGASWEYSLNGGTSWAAGSGTGLTLAEGIYTTGQIQVRQIDGAGLRGTAAQMGAVTVDNTAPALLSISRAGGTSARTNADSLTFLARFDSPIYALDAGDFQVTGSTATVTALTDIGSNTYAVTVAGGDLASLNGAVTLRLGAGADVADAAGNAAVTSSGALVESYLLDNSPPVLSNAQVEDSTLTLTSSEALSAFSTTGLEVRVNGVVRAVTASSMTAENIILTLATPVFNGDTVTLSYDADGNGVVDLAGNAAVDTSLTVTNNTDPIPVIEEDGVSITTTMGVDSQGRQTETLSISPSGTRPDDDPFAQIDLVSGDNAPILSASLPPGVGLTVSGTTLPLSASDSAQFLAAQLLSLDGSADISSMFNGAAGDGSITVRTITLSGSGTGDLPISFSGSTDGNAQTLILLDARNLNGATLVLDNLSYVVVLGNVTVTGGAGSTVAIGDDGVQNMVLGADDDTLHGGGGNDTIGSAAGDDLLFGDAGNDSIFGGIGDDSLSGGSGNDTIDGGDGRDAVLINAAYDTVAISQDNTGTLTVSYGNGETDIIRNAEILRFDDHVMLVDQPDRPMESQRGLTFDEDLYLQLYPDVAAAIASGAVAGAEEHYELYGAAEGRRPNALFNELWYRANNPDVDMAIKAGLFSTAFEHYQTYGWLEGRNPSGLLNMAAINPDRLTFDADYYLAQNPDVAGAVGSGVLSSALEHYMRYGQAEGRDPNALFDEDWYLSTYADAKAAVTSGLYKNGYQHYLAVGWKQGYDPSVWMDTSDYLADNPDVAASGQDPLSHYLNWGIREGRTITAVQDGDWLL